MLTRRGYRFPVRFLITTSILCFCGSLKAESQEPIALITQPPSRAVPSCLEYPREAPQPRCANWWWQSHLAAVGRAGDDYRQGGGAILFAPLWQSPSQILFGEGRVLRMKRQTTAGAGIGIRKLFHGCFAGGLNLFADYSRSDRRVSRWQISGGAELFGNRWHARLNGYLPQQKATLRVPKTESEMRIDGNLIVIDEFGEGFLEQGYRGFDAEGGFCFRCRPKSELWGYAGYFHYSADHVRDMNGPRLRAECRFEDLFNRCQARLTVGVEWQYDRVRKSQENFYVSLRLPLGCCRPASCCPKCSLYRRMGDSVHREPGITLQTQDIGIVLVAREILPEQLFFIWNSPGNPGAGTQEDPTNIVDGTNRAGPDDLLVFLQDLGDIQVSDLPGNTIISAVNQQYLGYGDNERIVVTLSNGTQLVITPLLGRDGTRAVLDGAAGFPLLQLANGVRIEGLTFDGGTDQIVGTNVTDILIQDMILTNSSSAAVNISGLSSVSVLDSMVTNAGAVGIRLADEVSAILQRNTIGSTGDGISITANPTAPLVNLIEANSDITSSSGSAVSVAVVGTGGYQLSLSDNNLTGGGGAGAQLDNQTLDCANMTITGFANNTVNGAPGGTGGLLVDFATFNQVNGGTTTIGSLASRVQGDGLRLNMVRGSLDFANLTVFNNSGTGLFVRDCDGKVGSFMFGANGGVIDTTDGAAIDIDPVMIDVTLASVSSTNSPTDGISLNQVVGSFTVTGATTIQNPTLNGISMIDSDLAATFNTIEVTTPGVDGISVSNSSGTFTASSATITSPTSNGVEVTDGDVNFNIGTLNVNGGVNGVRLFETQGSFTASGGTIQSAANDAFQVLGATAPTVSFSGTITNTTNHPVNINATTGGTATFNGLIDESGGASSIQVMNSGMDVVVDNAQLTNMAANGVDLQDNTASFSLSNSFVTFSPGFGISATNIADLSVDTCDFNNLGSTAIDLNEVNGTATVTDCTIDVISGNGVDLTAASSSGTLNVLNSGISGTGGTTQTAVNVSMGAAANMDINVVGTPNMLNLVNGVVISGSGTANILVDDLSVLQDIGSRGIFFMQNGGDWNIHVRDNIVINAGFSAFQILSRGTINGTLEGNRANTTGSSAYFTILDSPSAHLLFDQNQALNAGANGFFLNVSDSGGGGANADVIVTNGSNFFNAGASYVAQTGGVTAFEFLCLDLRDNTTDNLASGIELTQNGLSIFNVPQASAAALSAANGGMNVATAGVINFGSPPCTPPTSEADASACRPFAPVDKEHGEVEPADRTIAILPLADLFSLFH